MHIYLIGYRGCGKSTVARLLAQQLQRPLVDSDVMVEETAGQSISQIFAAEGEAGFRHREEQAVRTISAERTPSIVALGGGAVLRDANRRAIHGSGHVVWLQGSPQFLYERISADASSQTRRPQLSSRGGYAEVVEILAAREPLYRQMAEKIVATDGRSPEQVMEDIAVWVNSLASSS